MPTDAADLPPNVQALVDAYARAKEAAARANGDFYIAARAAARALVDSGLTLRDAGDVLGISHARVAQLLQTDRQDHK